MFRGPAANPAVENTQLPEQWSPTENIEWKSEIPGRGWSSPIVTGNKVFLTTVTTDGESKKPQTGIDFSNEYVAELMKEGLSEEEVKKRVTERDIELPNEVTLHYWLICLDLQSGQTIWQKEFHVGQPPGGRHRKNSFSSETPVTDGENVFVYVGNLGQFAFDLDGNAKWQKSLEANPIYLDFGTGSSPVLHENQLIIVSDNEENSYIASFDKGSGNLLWKTDRPKQGAADSPLPNSGWVTPFVWQHQQRTEIFTLGPGIATSYDLSGNILWTLKGVTVAPAASSFEYQGNLIVDGGRGSAMLAIRPGGKGDISLETGSTSNDFVAWSKPRTGTYIPTPVAYDGGLYVLNDKGILVRLDTETGEQSYKTRISSSGPADFTTSPWAYNGKVFCLSEQGNTYVIQAGKEFNLLHTNALGELAMASPAIVGNRLLLRTESGLYSIKSN